MTDLSYAIEQLEWLVREDFKTRNSETLYLDSGVPAYACGWWSFDLGRRDIARVRSYIAALRILRRVQP